MVNPDPLKREAQPHVSVKALYGEVTSGENGEWIVTPKSRGSALGGPTQVMVSDVDRIERGAVFTFELRKDVRWQPGAGHTDQLLDARDVYFSWSIYANPEVDCDEKRFQFEKVTGCEVVDDHTVRFFYQEQYAFALGSVGRSLTLLPSHVYDLSDPDNVQHDPRASGDEAGRAHQRQPAQQQWIGLGPYRVTAYNDQYVEVERFTDEEGRCLYFDRDNAGYLDRIRYRVIADDEAAMNAVLNGEPRLL